MGAASAEEGKVRYRSNVAAILRRESGEILVAKRLGLVDAWQFPQGGVDKGEDLEEALYREVEEELGVAPRCYEIKTVRDGYRYRFDGGRLKEGKYGGQEQTYYLCLFNGCDSDIDLEAASHAEFDDYRWIEPGAFEMRWVPEFKKEVYRRVFADFFEVGLG